MQYFLYMNKKITRNELMEFYIFHIHHIFQKCPINKQFNYLAAGVLNPNKEISIENSNIFTCQWCEQLSETSKEIQSKFWTLLEKNKKYNVSLEGKITALGAPFRKEILQDKKDLSELIKKIFK